MGPPPPPPPPPILKPTASLPFSGRKTTNAPRRDNNSISASSQPSRPRVDSQALQHAAARLRKTGYHEQIRGDIKNLSDGRLDRSNEQLSGQHWQNCKKQHELDSHQTREPLYAPSFGSNEPSSHSHVYRNSNSVNLPFSSQILPNSSNASHNTLPPSENRTTVEYITNARSKILQPPSPGFSPISTTTASNIHNSFGNDNSLHHASNSYFVQAPNSLHYHKPINVPIKREYTSSSSSSSFSNTRSNEAILDPQTRLHTFATQTYVNDQPGHHSNLGQSRSGIEPAFTHSTNPFAVELRDRGLTVSQREANQFRHSQRRADSELPFDVNELLKNSFRGDEVDQLVIQMANQLRGNEHSHPSQGTSFSPSMTNKASSTMSTTRTNVMQRSNICVACNSAITFEKPGCVALDQVFHVSCFNCNKCGRILAGSSFYNIENNPTCESCYTESLDKCMKCEKPISDKLLRACGGTFHVECFTCTVCNTALDGVPFTVDSDNNVHCVPCFHEKFAPRCAVCQRGIIPVEGEKESVRVVAMDKSFHVDCYRCEDCGLQLSSKIEGQGCYPLDSHLYCKTCNSNRLRVLANA